MEGGFRFFGDGTTTILPDGDGEEDGARGDVLTEVAGRLGVGRRVLEERDITGFYVRGEPEDASRQLMLSGLVIHGAIGVESVMTREDGDVLRVEVRGGLARNGVDGNLNA